MSTRIALVAIDNDGCLLRNETSMYDLSFVMKMRNYAEQAEEDPDGPVPRFTFLTGRPQPYVECMTKTFGVTVPAIFESGGGMDLGRSRIELAPEADDAALETLDRARAVFRRTVLTETPGFLQPGKDVTITVIPHDASQRPHVYERVAEIVEQESLDLTVIRAARGADVLLPGIDKGTGLDWLRAKLDLTRDEVAGIGDSRGDIPFLEKCGWSACPANAVDDIRNISTYISPYEAEEGVLDIMERVIDMNAGS